MMRYFVSGICFLLLWIIETSFFSSLPSFVAVTPIVFASAVYLIQYQGLMDGFVWILLYGILLQVFHLTTSPFPLLGFCVAATASLLSARHVFSNRSFYGVAACALTGFFSLVVTESLLLLFQSFGSKKNILWGWFFQIRAQEAIMLVFSIGCLFILARPIRRFLRLSTY